LTLTTSNTYTGGTTISGPGLVNINYGGVGGADSALGTGTLNLNTGAKLDNTSGHAVVLNTVTPIAINWNDDWTFLGSSPLDLGPGQVTLGNVEVVLTVVSNTLTVKNPITDNGNVYKLTKQGNGTLTLSNANNNFSGGLDLENGTLNLNADSAGQGILNIGGGILDNTSGTGVTLSTPSKLDLLASFTFNGTGNLNLGSAQTTIGGNPQIITLNGAGALETDGIFLGGNRATTVTGTGRWIIGGGGNNSGLGLTINGGTVYFDKSFGNAVSGGNPVAINTGGNLVMMSATGTQFGATTPVTLGGGTLDMNGDSETIASLTFNSGTLRNSADNTTATLTTSGSFVLGSTNCILEVDGTNGFLVIPRIVSGAGSLIKTGPGTLDLSTNETYTGATSISGTLALVGSGSVSTSPAIILADSAAVLDVTGSTDTNGAANTVLTLNSGQALSGIGLIRGGLTTLAGSTVAPGTPSSVGTLSVSNDIALGGALVLNLNRTNAQTSSKLVSLGGAANYTGTLSVTNVGPLLQVNDTFQLFPSAVTTFSAINLATTDANGMIYTWQNHVANDGSIKILSVQPPVNLSRTNISLSVSGNVLTLSWPADHKGWYLQSQTNSALVGLTTNWVTVPGSDQVTATNIAINSNNGSVFYRMVYP
jgi:fibronectin-binding autotransporter adhesin